MPSRGRATIVGVSEVGLAPDAQTTALSLRARAVAEAMTEAGMALMDVDGLFVAKGGDMQPGERPVEELAEFLQVHPQATGLTTAGGCGPAMLIEQAAAAIEAGDCEVAVVAYASTQASSRSRKPGGQPPDANRFVGHLERAAGLPVPIGPAAFAATRHMEEFGTTAEQMASVAVAARHWSSRNPAALRRDLITVENVLDSPMICEPLHRLDICLVTDGAGAVVLTSPNRSHGHHGSVEVLGTGQAHGHTSVHHADDLVRSVAGESSSRALARAAVALDDVDLLQVYDAFTIMPIVLLEDLGVCDKGEGGPFVASGATMPGGRWPMNTQGGGLAHAHPGVYGIFQVVEAVRQLRHVCGDRQVPEVEIALCHASGGGAFTGSQASLVLGRVS